MKDTNKITLFDGQLLTNENIQSSIIRCPCGRKVKYFYLDEDEEFKCPCGKSISTEPIQYKINIEG